MRLQPEDILFAVRGDRRRFGRCAELLLAAEEIAAAKRAFEADEDK